MRIRTIQQILVVAAFLFGSVSFALAGTISLSSSGAGVYTVQGIGLENVGGIHVWVTYDAAALANPKVEVGGLAAGTMSAANAATPGALNFAILSSKAINGSGPIATITFVRKGAAAGTAQIVKQNVINLEAKAIPTGIQNPSDTTQVADQTGSSDTNTQGNGSTPPPSSGGTTYTPPKTATITTAPTLVGGTITFTSDEAAAKEKKETARQPEPRESAEPSTPDRQVVARETPPPAPEAREPEAAAKKEEPAQKPQPVGVLERFRTYKGEHTLKALSALFAVDSKAYHQEPPILIADGKATLKLTILNATGSKAPNFGLSGATLVSMKKKGKGDWMVEAKPLKGTCTAVVTMLLGDNATDFPLVVAPKALLDLDKSGDITEADFALFRKNVGTDKVPAHDLNGDGKRDYQDEYVFVANYLVDHMAKEKGKEKPKKKKTKKGEAAAH